MTLSFVSFSLSVTATSLSSALNVASALPTPLFTDILPDSASVKRYALPWASLTALKSALPSASLAITVAPATGISSFVTLTLTRFKELNPHELSVVV